MGDKVWIDNARADDVATWPTKEDLRTQLQLTDRTIERWVKRGKLRAVQRRAAGFKSFPCYNPDDVRLLMKDIVEVVPVAPTRPTQPTFPTVISDTTDRHDIATQLSELAKILTKIDLERLIMSLLSGPSKSDVSLSEKTHLSLKEAVKLSGWSEKKLKALVYAGRLEALKEERKNGRWGFLRADIKAITNKDIAYLPGMKLLSYATDTTRATSFNGGAQHEELR